MDSLYILQYTSFIFMVVNALLLAGSRLNVRWKNARYEQSRIWLIFAILSVCGGFYLAIVSLLLIGLGLHNGMADMGGAFLWNASPLWL